jgi:pimeloyl-ACP methyl ester carboxylesterase
VSWRQRRRELYRRRPKFAGPPVVLLHAGGMDGRMWRPVVERLEDRYWLIVPDMRGHGTTPLPPGKPYSDVEDVLGVLDDLKVEDAAFAGCSFGGRVALQVATAAPERVNALALFASPVDWSDPPSAELKAFFEQEEALVEGGDIDAAVDLNVRTWVREPECAELVADMARRSFEHQAGVEAPEREMPIDLGSIAVPTLAVSAGLDFPDFAKIADQIVAEVPNAQRAEVPDAGHLIPLERPDETAELLATFLEGVGS